MSFVSKIKSYFSPSQWETSDQWLRVNLFSEYSEKDLHQLSKTDYLNFYKWRCFVAVSTIAKRLAGLERHVVDQKGKQVDDPNASLITFDLLVNIVSYMKLNWACYIRKNMVGKRVVELVVLRPDMITPVLNSANTQILWYKYTINWISKTFPVEEIIVVANFNPMLPYPMNVAGMSDVQAIATAIDADYQASKRNRKFFYNNASVNSVLETDKDISQEGIDKITRKREQKYRGVDNSNKVWILTGGLKYKPVNPSQKEMDFIESRKFNRDEILGFFGVPKSILGLWEGDNALNVRAFEQIFARNILQPTCIIIEEALNKGGLFEKWYFEFVNIVPNDLTETRNDYINNGITLNEFRATRGYAPMKDGDKLHSAYQFAMEDMIALPQEWKSQDTVTKDFRDMVHKGIERGIARNTKGTEEYNQKLRETKIARIDSRRVKAYKQKLGLIFWSQQREILSEYDKRYNANSKDFKKKNFKANFPLLSIAKWTMVYQQILSETQRDLVQTEWNHALVEVGLDASFDITGKVEAELKKNIAKFAGSIDSDTNLKLEDNFKEILSQGMSASEWRDLLMWTFDQLETTRAEMIVRTETMRASNYATQEGRKQSWAVVKKERYTATDERVCEYCGPLHWTTIGLEENFYDEGSTVDWANGGQLKADYWAIENGNLHPNCRCTILPITE